MVDTIRIMLGWVGLGLSSYLLVIYCGSSEAYKNKPVTSWIPKHIPRNEPKFHIVVILLGVRRLTNELKVSIRHFIIKTYILNFNY